MSLEAQNALAALMRGTDKPKLMMGLLPAEYHRKASGYARTGILLWLLAGCVYIACTGRFIGLPTLLLFVPGIIASSLLAGIAFLVSQHLWWSAAKRDAETWAGLQPRASTGGTKLLSLLFLTVGHIAQLVYSIAFVNTTRESIG